jgi:purine-binding chemotaxis protein CheW
VVVEERQAGVWTATPPARPPERPAPKPRPTASPARPAAAGQGKKMTVIPLKVEEDWLVNDLREPFVPAAAKVEFEGKTGAPLLPGAKADEDFFSLATEELYQHEFNRAAEGDLGTQLELLSFRLGQEIYAVRLTSIRQIIKLVPITTVPRAPDYVLGILSLRGAVIPVFDLRRRLRLGLTEPTRKSRIVVVAVGKFMVGLIVDEVMQVVRLPETKLEPPPSMLNAVEAEYIEAIGRTGAKMIILLALEKILTPVSGNKG